MRYNSSIDAWTSDSIDDAFCPFCGLDLHVGYQECSCGKLLNVEQVSTNDSDTYIVTEEKDEMRKYAGQMPDQTAVTLV